MLKATWEERLRRINDLQFYGGTRIMHRQAHGQLDPHETHIGGTAGTLIESPSATCPEALEDALMLDELPWLIAGAVTNDGKQLDTDDSEWSRRYWLRAEDEDDLDDEDDEDDDEDDEEDDDFDDDEDDDFDDEDFDDEDFDDEDLDDLEDLDDEDFDEDDDELDDDEDEDGDEDDDELEESDA